MNTTESQASRTLAARAARHQNAVVRKYLTLRQEVNPHRGRRHSADTARRRLAAKHIKLAHTTDVIERLVIIAAIHALEDRIFEIEAHERKRKEFLALQDEFLAIMKPFSKRLRITFEVWIDYGLPATLVRRGGLQPRI